MYINPLWSLCITIRILIIFIAVYIVKYKSKNTKLIASIILYTIGFGFLIKALTGSNNEVQISKVFWHDTRLVHSVLYMLAGYYLYNGNSVICGIVLGLDVLFSILYRILTNQ